jgi:hypothetical protein
MDEKKKRELHQQALTTQSIRQEFEQTLQERVKRYLEVKPHVIIPNAPFAAPSSECSFLYRDGHFYACIALVQAVAEAIVRYICDIDLHRYRKDFKTNVEKLYKGKFISDKIRESLLKIWEKRNAYHHLNSGVESDRRTLGKLAKEKACLLFEVESEIFEVSHGKDGNIIFKYPKYWRMSGDKAEVFLRFEP